AQVIGDVELHEGRRTHATAPNKSSWSGMRVSSHVMTALASRSPSSARPDRHLRSLALAASMAAARVGARHVGTGVGSRSIRGEEEPQKSPLCIWKLVVHIQCDPMSAKLISAVGTPLHPFTMRGNSSVSSA